MRGGLLNVFCVAVLLAVAPAVGGVMRSSIHGTAIGDRESELTLILAEAAKSPIQTRLVRTTADIDTTGWVLIAMVHGPDGAVVREGQLVRAFSTNSRTRLRPARITRVTRLPSGVRVEATLATRVLGIPTRYLMEIITESI